MGIEEGPTEGPALVEGGDVIVALGAPDGSLEGALLEDGKEEGSDEGSADNVGEPLGRTLGTALTLGIPLGDTLDDGSEDGAVGVEGDALKDGAALRSSSIKMLPVLSPLSTEIAIELGSPPSESLTSTKPNELSSTTV